MKKDSEEKGQEVGSIIGGRVEGMYMICEVGEEITDIAL